ncbi:MAG: AgmX/PglI C-terminal domain-containing protein [Deltaproteobacteria bacterium]|nr:AgmX/PglI C-terminal domain-containing protein [Deltaproteobacteria bacterium]
MSTRRPSGAARGCFAVAFTLALGACGGQSKGPDTAPPPPKTTLTNDQVREHIASKSSKLAACYRAEQLNSDKASDYVFQLDIPASGAPHTVTLVSETIPDQRVLKECVADVLKSVRFPAFDQPSKVVLEVPIRSSGS